MQKSCSVMSPPIFDPFFEISVGISITSLVTLQLCYIEDVRLSKCSTVAYMIYFFCNCLNLRLLSHFTCTLVFTWIGLTRFCHLSIINAFDILWLS